MIFFSLFKSLVGKDLVVELKNDMSLRGTLVAVDQFMNIKITNVTPTDPKRFLHMLCIKNCFIRGSVIRYIHLSPNDVDVSLLQDTTRKELEASKDK